jgi:5-hydroxyisourate hydrolase-like protein (transthyretin family)
MAPLLFLGLLALQAPAAPARDTSPRPAETYTIRGRVTDVTSGQPIRGVAISIRPSSQMQEPARGTFTDDEGRWAFAGLAAGDYSLNHDKPGYTKVQGVRIYSPVHVSSQFPVRELELVLMRGGVVAGRVTDPRGEPAVDVQVQAFRVLKDRSAWTSHQDRTDDRGEFRLYGLVPGEYLLAARPGQRNDNVIDDDISGLSPVVTYYPGTVSEAEAERITLTELGAVSDLAFQMQTARTFMVSGRIVASSSAVDEAFVRLEKPDGASMASRSMAGVTGDGRFRLTNVVPGEYRLIAEVRLEDGEEFGEADIVIADQDIEVAVATRKPTVVRGRVMTPSGQRPAIGRLNVGASPVVATPSFHGGQRPVREDGTFELTVSPQPFRLRLWSRDNGLAWRTREVRWRGERVGKDGIDGTGPVVDGVEIVVVAATARLQGSARDAAGAVMKEGTVVIVPAEEVGEPFPEWHRAVIADGRFVSPPVPEGRYLVAAVSAVAPGQITAEVVARVRERGDTIELSEREFRTIALGAFVDTPR